MLSPSHHPAENRLVGTIVRLIPEKKAGWIRVDSDPCDYYFVKHQLVETVFEHLVLGDSVSFIPYDKPEQDIRFANKIILEKTYDQRDQRIIGRVCRIFREENYGFIEVNDPNADRYFKASEITNLDFSLLKVGDRVSFIERLSKQNARFANKIIVLDISCKTQQFHVLQRHQGQITQLIPDRYAGRIICDDNNEELYFVAKQLLGFDYADLTLNQQVSFEIGLGSDGRKFANKIAIISPLDFNTQTVTDKSQDYSLGTKPERVSTNDVEKIDVNSNVIAQKIIDILSRVTNIHDPLDFENGIFLLLKLIGIHSIYQYSPHNQAGRGDGFFTIGSLAVMYDCTLRSDFESFKKDQIENYIHKMEQSHISFEIKNYDGSHYTKSVKIAGKNRQVWIITKGKTRQLSGYGSIQVKEVGVEVLISVLQARLRYQTLEEEELSLNILSCLERA